MKRITSISILFCLFQLSFSQAKLYTYIFNNEDFLLTNNENFSGKDTLVISYYDNGNVKSTGKYAIDNYGKKSSLKIGNWIFYYSDGQIESSGNYEISSYKDCGTGGLERIYYNYKIGDWIYYTQDSNLEAKGQYKKIKTKIDTRCEGGDDLIFMDFGKNWYFANKTNRSKYLKISEEFDDGFYIVYYYDSKSKKVIVEIGSKKI